MLYALALTTAVLPSSVDIEPADWECARPLLEKNALRQIDAKALAARIADECKVPYEPNTANEIDAALEPGRKNLYNAKALLFQQELLNDILKRRRARDVPLVR